MRPRALLALVLVAAVVVAGCGETTTARDFRLDAATIASIAAEGALLAHEVGEQDTTRAFARVHGRELGDTAAELAATLRRSKPVDPVPAGRLAAVAGQVSRRLHVVASLPPPGRAFRLERELKRLSERASKLEEHA
jgi:Ser/Thr protein kinase RdoA (MazF antagonist)